MRSNPNVNKSTTAFQGGGGHNNFQKKIKDYVISFSPTEFYGKNIHGEIRTGYSNKDNKILIFRIIPLPLSNSMRSFIHLQQSYSTLSQYARIVHEPVESSSNFYLPMEYLSKTFEGETNNFRGNPKYFDQFIEKFLRVYAFFYNMKVAHGNITAQNIGVTFDGKVKFMDFGLPLEGITFEERSRQDFLDFKMVIGRILEKDQNFPAKFSCFNQPDQHTWQHLLSLWHVTSPLEPLYITRRGFVDNIVTLLYKLSETITSQCREYKELKLSMRLLQMQYLLSSVNNQFHNHKLAMITNALLSNHLASNGNNSTAIMEGNEEEEEYEAHCRELENLREAIGAMAEYDLEFYNSVMMGAIRDNEYYEVSPTQRLVLICCLIKQINHQYLYLQVINQFQGGEGDNKRDLLLGDSLMETYREEVRSNLLKGGKE